MRRRVLFICCFLVFALQLVAQGLAQFTNRVTYMLLEGSTLTDDCLICGRPTIQQPLRGTFDLILIQDTAPYTKYAVSNINFTSRPGPGSHLQITGEGIYSRFEQFALLQDMDLALDIKDEYTNRVAYFTNESRNVQRPFPLIQITLPQTNGTLIQTYSLELFVAPVREIWFSTTQSFEATNLFAPTNKISDGDLLSSRGRVVKSNGELVGRLGIMPGVPDLGLDAVAVGPHAGIMFSIPSNVFSESLGPIQHGDLLSSRGAIVKRNQDLLAGFRPVSSEDAGLDAVQIMSKGEILFSIRSNIVLNSGQTIAHGDILSERGIVFMTNQQLLANFRPVITNYDFGLDAFYTFPSGEIWFSVAEDFTDKSLGLIKAGDLLSSFGYRAVRNEDLVASFGLADPTQGYGLDALFVISDTLPQKPPPRIVQYKLSGQFLHLDWDGEGSVFQLEQSGSILGPWLPCGPIVPDLSADTRCETTPGSMNFYRLRQW